MAGAFLLRPQSRFYAACVLTPTLFDPNALLAASEVELRKGAARTLSALIQCHPRNPKVLHQLGAIPSLVCERGDGGGEEREGGG
jgi:hypothetical protein